MIHRWRSLGSRKWSMGPLVVVLANLKPWVVGLLARQLWSFAGSDRRSDVSQLLLQPFVNYNLSGGWYLSTSPILTANWEGQLGEKWTVPLGGGAGRAFVWEKLLLNVSLQAFYNIVRPDFGADWQTRFTVQFVF